MSTVYIYVTSVQYYCAILLKCSELECFGCFMRLIYLLTVTVGRPIPAVLEFDAQLQVLELLDHKVNDDLVNLW